MNYLRGTNSTPFISSKTTKVRFPISIHLWGLTGLGTTNTRRFTDEPKLLIGPFFLL